MASLDHPSTSDTSHLLTAGDFGHNADDVLVRDENSSFKPLRTIPVALLQIFLNAVMFAESVYYLRFSGDCNNQTSPVPVFNKSQNNVNRVFWKDCGSIVIYSIALLWILTWTLNLMFKIFHSRHQNTGYLQLYTKTKHIAEIPLAVVSVGSLFLLVAVTLRQDRFVFTGVHIIALGESRFWLFLQLLTGLELIIISIALLVYIVKIAKFNSLQPVPDVFSETTIASMPVIFNPRSTIEFGPGVRETNKEIALLQSVCERQGDLINCLRHRCDVLAARLHQATGANS